MMGWEFGSDPAELVSTEWSGEPVSPVEFVSVPERGSHAAREAIQLLDVWMAETRRYDEGTWPELKKRLEKVEENPRRPLQLLRR